MWISLPRNVPLFDCAVLPLVTGNFDSLSLEYACPTKIVLYDIVLLKKYSCSVSAAIETEATVS